MLFWKCSDFLMAITILFWRQLQKHLKWTNIHKPWCLIHQGDDCLFLQDKEADLFSGSSKSNTIKASTKLFLFQRLNSKKQKNNKPFAKDQEENQTNYAVPDPNSPVSPKVSLVTVTSLRIMYMFCHKFFCFKSVINCL